METSLSKVTQSNSGSKEGKSVVVLLSSDVEESDGKVYLPNFSGQKALRKKEKGQFNDNVLFTWKMTEEDVRKEILSHFTYLKDQSFWCASATDNHRGLDFHGVRRVWDGKFIKRTIRGNSVLYISTGMTADDLSKALQEPTDEWSSQQIPTFTLCSNKKSMLKERKNDQDAQQGLPMVQPVVSPLVKCKKGNYGLAINQAALQNQWTKVTIAAPAPAPASAPAPAPASAPASAPIQLVCFPATQTSMRRTVSPGQLPQLTIEHLKQSQPPEGSVQGQYQIVVPQGIPSQATAGSSQGVLVQRAGRVPLKMPPGESSVQWQRDSGCELSKEDCANNGVCKSEESFVPPRAVMIPDWAYTKEEKKFTIYVSDLLPCDASLYKADFEGLGVANLTLKNPYTLVGVIPISQSEGEVKVAILRFTENVGYVSFGEDLKFTYKDKMSELLKEVLVSEDNRNAALEGLCKGLLSASAGSDDLNAFRLPEAGMSSITESDDSKSVKLLTMLIYVAAQNNSLEFVDFIFSTSVGKVVFSHYKNNPTLPEDVARANGHPILENYLGIVNKRLSKERIEDKSETVNWLELKHALEKKQDQPCNDAVQTPMYSESDENQLDYDADDEVSNSSSSVSGITDLGCEDENQDTTDLENMISIMERNFRDN